MDSYGLHSHNFRNRNSASHVCNIANFFSRIFPPKFPGTLHPLLLLLLLLPLLLLLLPLLLTLLFFRVVYPKGVPSFTTPCNPPSMSCLGTAASFDGTVGINFPSLTAEKGSTVTSRCVKIFFFFRGVFFSRDFFQNFFPNFFFSQIF